MPSLPPTYENTHRAHQKGGTAAVVGQLPSIKRAVSWRVGGAFGADGVTGRVALHLVV